MVCMGGLRGGVHPQLWECELEILLRTYSFSSQNSCLSEGEGPNTWGSGPPSPPMIWLYSVLNRNESRDSGVAINSEYIAVFALVAPGMLGTTLLSRSF